MCDFGVIMDKVMGPAVSYEAKTILDAPFDVRKIL